MAPFLQYPYSTPPPPTPPISHPKFFFSILQYQINFFYFLSIFIFPVFTSLSYLFSKTDMIL